VDAQTILNGCYDGLDLNNAFCKLINPRNPDSTFANPALLQSSLNFAAEHAQGIDLDVAYNRSFNADNKLALRVLGTWVQTRTDYPYIDAPSRPLQQKGVLGDPIFAFNASADYTYRRVTVGYEFRYIGRQAITAWEAQHTTYGVPPLDPFYADRVYYPSVIYHNVRATFNLDKRFGIYGGMDNLSDEKPPLGLTGTGDGSGIFDNVGRFLYVGFKFTV